MRLGYETGNTPFYLRFTKEPYYKGHQYVFVYCSIRLEAKYVTTVNIKNT